MPTISVITAVFNRADTIGQALESVQAQTCPGVEHVVIDGASTDGTLAVLESRRAHIAVLVCEQDAGIYDALNKGLGLATGEVEVVAPGSPAANFAFDVTPARYVTALITDRGVCPATESGLLSLFPERAITR